MPQFICEHTPADLDDFTRAYAECVEWLLDDSTDNERGISDRDLAEGFAAETVEKMRRDCAAFQEENAADLDAYQEATGRDLAGAGHDFWLTRNRHGAGFWDRGDDPCLTR